MAERKAQQKYYPPEWEPKYGMLNKFHGTHHLRERASKLKSEGIMVIRFEMPWNIWCNGCEKVIIKGRRFNAEKKVVGNYFSTKIFDFKMPCFMCGHEIHVQTDPEHRDYKVVSGGRRKVEDWTPALQQSEAVLDEDERNAMRADPLKRLEHLSADKQTVLERVDQFSELVQLQERNTRDDYAANRRLREAFRAEKRTLADADAERRAKGLTIPLLPASSEDAAQAAALVADKTRAAPAHADYRSQQRSRIAAASIFAAQPAANGPSPSSSSSSSLSSTEREKLLQKALKQGLLHKGKLPIGRPSSSLAKLPPLALKK